MKSRTLHISELSTKNACREQIVVFYETFGEQVEVTVEKAREFGGMFDIAFAAKVLLSESAFAKHKANRTRSFAEYVATCAELAAMGNDDHASAGEKYWTDCAAMWADLYINDEVTA